MLQLSVREQRDVAPHRGVQIARVVDAQDGAVPLPLQRSHVHEQLAEYLGRQRSLHILLLSSNHEAFVQQGAGFLARVSV